MVRTRAGDGTGMQAGSLAGLGRDLEAAQDAVNPEQLPPILPQGLVVPQGSDVLTRGRRGTHLPGYLTEPGQHAE